MWIAVWSISCCDLIFEKIVKRLSETKLLNTYVYRIVSFKTLYPKFYKVKKSFQIYKHKHYDERIIEPI